MASFTRSASASASSGLRCLAIDGFAADLQHHRHRKRRYVVERRVDDVALDSRKHLAEAADVEKAGRRILPRGAQQDVVGLVAAQHVVDEVGRDGHLAPGLLLAG